MNTQELLNDFRQQLLRCGLPIEYAQEAAEELADHHRDVVEELCDTGMHLSTAENAAAERLGDTRQLVKNSVREYQRRHWCGRWPLLTFLIGPVLLLLVTWIATILFLFGLSIVFEALGFEGQSDGVLSTAEYVVTLAFIGWFAFLMPIAVMWFLSRKASIARLSKGWLALAAIVLALNVGTMKVGFVDNPPRKSMADSQTGEMLEPDQFVISTPLWIFFGTSLEGFQMLTGSPQQLGQLLVPLFAAFILMGYNEYRSRQSFLLPREQC